MKKILGSIVLIIAFALLVGIGDGQSVFAYGTKNRPNLISSWNVTGDVVQNGSVTGFKVSITYGSDCKDGNTNLCSEVSGSPTAFKCGDSEQMHWDNNSSLWNNGSISISYSKKEGNYFIYNATIKPTDWYSGATDWTVHQRINFKFKRKIQQEKKFTLTSIAVARHNGVSLGQIDQKTNVPEGDSASVSGNAAIAGYEFVGWNATCPGPDNVNITCTVNPLVADTTVQAVYAAPRYLTAYAWDRTTQTALNGGNPVSGPVKTWYNEGASVSTSDFAGYSWVGWDLGGSTACANSTLKTCTIDNLLNDTVVYAYYDRDTFYGRSTLSGSASADTGFQTTSTTASTGYINDCSPVNGCSVSFNHYLQSATGNGTTSYNIQRHSNLITSTRAVSGGEVVGNTTWNQSTASLHTSTLTMYPGMVLCEWLSFIPYYGSGAVYTQVCASALGNAQPPDPSDPNTPEDPNANSGDSSYINIKVRNSSVAAYNKYSREVYAKPGYIDNNGNVGAGDTLYYRATYNPQLQYTYYIIPEQYQINGGTAANGNGSSTLGQLYDTSKGSSLSNWNNAFSIQFSSRGSSFGPLNPPANQSYTLGDFTKRIPTPNSQQVVPADAGHSIDERAITNEVDGTKTTPSQVSFTAPNVANVITDSKSSTAYARVPYNFVNTTSMTTPENNKYYAGENATAKIKINVAPRNNPLTDGTYATRVDEAKWKLRLCHNGICNETDPSNPGTLNEYGDIKGSVEPKDISFVVPDLPAGTEICLSSAVYPANSGDNNNWNNAAGNGAWSAWSAEQCFKVAKRPSIQVWGGSVYSGGNLNTGLSFKRLLYGYNDDNTINTNINRTDNPPYTFGSWSELGTVSRGSVSGFASGATIGYVSNNNGNLNPVPYASILAESPNSRESVGDNPGGSSKNRFCDLIPLTFANACDGNATTGTGGKDATSGITIDKDVLASLASSSSSAAEISGSINITDTAGDEAMIQHSADSLEITGGSLVRGTFRVVTSDKDIRISGNIGIDDNITMGTFRQAPKLVIFANNNIYIDCGVTNLYGLLVADKVITCGNGISSTDDMNEKTTNTINEQKNSNQLILQGAIVANRLYANRTYGAARGANSIVPAEIIKFDPTLYLWGGVAGINTEEENNSTVNGNMEITYVHELAPRY